MNKPNNTFQFTSKLRYSSPMSGSVYIHSVNKLNCHFAFASNSTKTKLQQAYCYASCGSQNWQLITEAVRGFHAVWNKAVQRTLGAPPYTKADCHHYWLITGLSQSKLNADWSNFINAYYPLSNLIGYLGENEINIRSKFDLASMTCHRYSETCL